MKLRKLTLLTILTAGTVLGYSNSLAINATHYAASYGQPTIQPAPTQAIPAGTFNTPARLNRSATERNISPITGTVCTVTIINNTTLPIVAAGKTFSPGTTTTLTSKCNYNPPAAPKGTIAKTARNRSNNSIVITYIAK